MPASASERRNLAYCRIEWPEQPVPEGAPAEIYYEYSENRDVVTRMVEDFGCGRLERTSLELSLRGGPDHRDEEHRSLVHGSFKEMSKGLITPISEREFDELWSMAADAPRSD